MLGIKGIFYHFSYKLIRNSLISYLWYSLMLLINKPPNLFPIHHCFSIHSDQYLLQHVCQDFGKSMNFIFIFFTKT